MMKRLFCLLTVLALLLTGCAIGQEPLKEPVTFHYLRVHETQEEYRTFFAEGAIGSELREATGHRQDLNYLLAMYLKGPLEEDLVNPFPVGCRTLEIRKDGRLLHIALNTVMFQLDELELTVACACLAQTCFELIDVDTVHIESRNPGGEILFTRDFTTDNLLLADSYTQPPEAAN